MLQFHVIVHHHHHHFASSSDGCTVTFTERQDHQDESWIAFVFNIEQENYVLQANDSSLKVKLTQVQSHTPPLPPPPTKAKCYLSCVHSWFP